MRYVVFPAVLITATFLQFGAQVAFAQQAVVYDFTAEWCGPCQKVNPIIHKLQREGLPIQQVDIDKNPSLAKQFKVSSIPAFVLVVDGKEVKRILGGQTTEQELRQLVAMIPARNARQQLAQTKFRKRPTSQKTAGGPPVLGAAMPFPASFATATATVPTSATNNLSAAAAVINRGASETPVIRAQLDNSSNATKPTPHIDSSAANVRIRIKDKTGIDYGSGTVIQSKPGVSYILTCGHIFRNFSIDSKVDVDIFTGDRFESYVGKVEKYDLDGDVGLISIPTDGVLPVARLAVLGSQVPKGETVISVGCSGGQAPTVQQLTVTALNRYTGPDNIECTGVPVQGRSGGGLLNLENEVVGVCIAADPDEKRGLYAGLKPILELVASCGLEDIVRQPASAFQPAGNLFAGGDANNSAPAMPEPPAAYPASGSVALNNNAALLNQSALQSANPAFSQTSLANSDIISQLQAATGSKLTIVIESPDHPGQTRVVIIPSATARLIADLTGELDNSQKVSAHRQVIPQQQNRQQQNRQLQNRQPQHSNANTMAPIQRLPRVEDRSMTSPTGFSAAQPYRRKK
ncbi:MAG: trypsin-like peptidase domain-containing protein [Planctomycetaceae bacterium]|nr:trypsin-like peptidase domain-containing protein [Planctomycetaceae bacterium]